METQEIIKSAQETTDSADGLSGKIPAGDPGLNG